MISCTLSNTIMRAKYISRSLVFLLFSWFNKKNNCNQMVITLFSIIFRSRTLSSVTFYIFFSLISGFFLFIWNFIALLVYTYIYLLIQIFSLFRSLIVAYRVDENFPEYCLYAQTVTFTCQQSPSNYIKHF